MDMKKLKIILPFISFLGLVLMSMACSNKEELIQPYESYVAIPKTTVGNAITNRTDLVASISLDTSYTVTTGVEATEIQYLSSTGLSMKVFIFEIDLSHPNVKIEVSTPNNQPAFGMQQMTKQATYEDAAGHKVWAGINADFFNTTNGTPQGVLHKEGVAIKTSVTDAVNTFFGITSDGKAVIGDQDEYAVIKNTLQEAVGGRVTLLKDGIAPPQTDKKLEPRTGIGVNQEGTKVYMFVVDGRRFHYSNGMNYDDMAKIMASLGAYDAINLDGGGSSTFFIRNTTGFDDDRFVLRNWPSDNGGAERAVANGLLIISTAD